MTKHEPTCSFPCKECEYLSQNHKGEGCDFCTLLGIWIDPKLSKEITCNARKRRASAMTAKKSIIRKDINMLINVMDVLQGLSVFIPEQSESRLDQAMKNLSTVIEDLAGCIKDD